MIVGVNKYKLKTEDVIEARDIDNVAVREGQIARLQQNQGHARCGGRAGCAGRYDFSSRNGTGNLLDLSIQAIRLRATVGEVSDALGKGFWPPPRRYQQGKWRVRCRLRQRPRRHHGLLERPQDINGFADKQGRRPRVMISKLGQDGHDRGAKVVATAFADLGFDVDMGPLFQTPEECARQAIENDVHAVGVIHTGRRPQDAGARHHCRAEKAGCGRHHRLRRWRDSRARTTTFMYAAGVKGIYGPGTPIPVSASAKDVLEQIKKATRVIPEVLVAGRCCTAMPPATPCHCQGHHAAGVHPERPPRGAGADVLLTALLPYSGQSFRLGISGVPGVGKIHLH